MKTLSLLELFELFGTDDAAEDWFIETRWPNGLRCAFCDGDSVGERGSHPTQRFHCLDCKKFYSVKTNSIMHASKLSYRKWAVAIYLFMTHPKGLSSIQLHKALGITQKSAWHLEHRIREALDTGDPALFVGPVEVDETFVGGRARNQTFERKQRLSKKPVVGMRDRATNRIVAKPIWNRESSILHRFVRSHTEPSAEVHTDEHKAYRNLPREHHTVNHSRFEYGPTNGIESFWALLKRAHMGIYHKMSHKHLHRYITELQERHNRRPMTTLERMKSVVVDGIGKRLKYVDLVKHRPELDIQPPPEPPWRPPRRDSTKWSPIPSSRRAEILRLLRPDTQTS